MVVYKHAKYEMQTQIKVATLQMLLIADISYTDLKVLRI